MNYQPESTNEIRKRVEEDILSQLGDKTFFSHSLAKILATTFAPFYRYLYMFIHWSFKQMFPWSADSEHLKRHGEFHGIKYLQPEFSSGTGLIKGSDGSRIEKGTVIYATATNLMYETEDSSVIKNGTAEIKIRGKSLGSEYNIQNLNTKFRFQEVQPGIQSEGIFTDGFKSGRDFEKDEDYLKRILNKTQNTTTSGSVSDYIYLAKTQKEVTRAFIYPAQGRAIGKLVITVINDNKPDLKPDNINEIQEFFEKEKQATDIVEVITPVIALVDIHFTHIDSEINQNIRSAFLKLFERMEPGGAKTIDSTDTLSKIPINSFRIELYKLGFTNFEFKVFINQQEINQEMVESGFNQILQLGEVK